MPIYKIEEVVERSIPSYKIPCYKCKTFDSGWADAGENFGEKFSYWLLPLVSYRQVINSTSCRVGFGCNPKCMCTIPEPYTGREEEASYTYFIHEVTRCKKCGIRLTDDKLIVRHKENQVKRDDRDDCVIL